MDSRYGSCGVRPEMARLSARDRLASSSYEEKSHGQRCCIGGKCSVSRPLCAHFPGDLYTETVLAKKGHSADEVEKMYAAWVKSCLLQVTLWSYPYVKAGDF